MRRFRRGRVLSLLIVAALLSGAGASLLGTCGPFSDVAADSFCPFVLEIFSLGITTGTTATTYEPGSNVTRLQMAAFLSRAVDGVLRRGSRRAALGQFWRPQGSAILALTTVGPFPNHVKSDGADVWVACDLSVSRVRASDGKLLGTWTATTAFGDPIVIALGRVVTPANENPGRLYTIDPAQPPGGVTTVASNLGAFPQGIAFDGARIWTSNEGGPGSVSIVTPGTSIPWTVTTVTAGLSNPIGALFDGTNVWVADSSLKKLDAAGAVLQTVTLGGGLPRHPAFDGSNIWVPGAPATSVSVVRASSGAILQTLTGNGLAGPVAAAFDGERILVTNNGNDSVSLWKAADLTPLGSFSTGAGTAPWGACSDGVNFWIAFNALQGQIARF